ncbi:MAG: hypothetical protein RIB52_01805 [Erythrobacter sp.]|uniref:hypothetical protein n=1 Tax=Erythrobacter sp. TaxID=1042 RepID=UPI0032EF8394
MDADRAGVVVERITPSASSLAWTITARRARKLYLCGDRTAIHSGEALQAFVTSDPFPFEKAE